MDKGKLLWVSGVGKPILSSFALVCFGIDQDDAFRMYY